MNHQLTQFSQFVLHSAFEHTTGLIPILSTKFISQQDTFDFLLYYLSEYYTGFVVYKNNQYPYDDFTDLKTFLKPSTIIFINQITNSYQYQQVLDLSNNNLVICGFECFCSSKNYLEDFIFRFNRVSEISYHIIKKNIVCAFICDYSENSNNIHYTLL